MYEANYDGGGITTLTWLVLFAMYFYFSFAQYRIAQKVGCADKAWWAFVPILNAFLLINMAGKEWFWFLFCLVPVINIIVFAVLWVEVARMSGHSPAWGILALVPFLNFVAVGVMAFSGGPPRAVELPRSGQIDTRKTTPVG